MHQRPWGFDHTHDYKATSGFFVFDSRFSGGACLYLNKQPGCLCLAVSYSERLQDSYLN